MVAQAAEDLEAADSAEADQEAAVDLAADDAMIAVAVADLTDATTIAMIEADEIGNLF